MLMKVSDYIIEYLANEGVKKIFLVYGAANGDLVDSIALNNRVDYVCCMHEQACGFAAEGYAKTTGEFGVALSTSGPGLHNMITSMGNCFYDSVPCLFMSGQINSRFLRPDESIRQVGFQESDVCSIAKPITKYAKTIMKAEDIAYELGKALHIMREGRPGPVLLDIPLDIQKQKIETDKLIGYEVFKDKIVPNKNKILSFLKDLENSERPCVIVGGGAYKDRKKVNEFLRTLQIPAFPTWNATDIVTSDFELYGGRIGTYGGAGRNFAVQNADLILCLGSRLSGRITGGNVQSFGRNAKKYIVDVDEAGLQKKLQQLPFDECIYSGVGDFIDVVNNILKEKTGSYGYLVSMTEPNKQEESRQQWIDKVMDWKVKYDPVLIEHYKEKNIIHPYIFVRELSKILPNDYVVVGDCGGNIVVVNHAFETKFGQRMITNNGNSPMGFSMCGAIGAALAGKNTICIIGDGGMTMNTQELQTMKNYNIPVKVIVLNNHIYGITKAYQETNFSGRSEACGPKGYSPPDFIKVADAYGIATMKIEQPLTLGEMKEKINSFLSFEGPMVIDVNCHEYHTYEPKIVGWETPIEDMYPYLPEEEFLSNMIVKPLDTYKNRFYPSIYGGKK